MRSYTKLGCIALCFLFVCVMIPLAAFGQSTTAPSPIALIPVGDSPFALSLVPNTSQAVVVNLFPTGPSSTNTNVVDYSTQKILYQVRAGTRLVAIATVGTKALVVNEDQDFVIVVDLTNPAAQQIQIPVGSRPSNVIVANSTTAIATNGTSGTISLINLQNFTVTGSQIPVGHDPRAVAISGHYAYVALGGDNAVAVIDLSTSKLVTTVGVGKNPVAIAVTPDGSKAVVCNLTNNTVSVLSLANPAAPVVISSASGIGQIPVGVEPSALDIKSDGSAAYIANLGSNWVTVVDLIKMAVAGVINIQRPDPANGNQPTPANTSGIRVSADGTKLLVTEFRSSADLLVYDLTSLKLAPAPAIDVPGEPSAQQYLNVNPALGCPGYYIATVQLAPGVSKKGLWGMQVLTTGAGDASLLQGGFNLGGAFDANANATDPGFGAFNIANTANEPQTVNISVLAQALPTTGFSASNLGLKVQLLDSNQNPIPGASVQGAPPLSLQQQVNPGFYVVRVTSLPNSPAGTFQMSLTTSYVNRPGGGFQGGVVVGGFLQLDANGNSLTGFGAFCVAAGQNVNITTYGGTQYGSGGAGDLVLSILDGNNNNKNVRTVNNSIPGNAGVTLPVAPSLSGITPTVYVNASATTSSGTGTQANPYKSITTALSKAKSGDVILVLPGTYSPSKTQEKIPITNSASGVKIIGSGASTTIIDAEQNSGTAGNANAFVINASHVRFAGFTVRGSTQFDLLVFNGNDVTVDSNFFTSSGIGGAGSTGGSGLVFSGNAAAATQASGFIVSGASVGANSAPPTGCPTSFGACIINNVSNDNRTDGILATQGGNVAILNNTTLNNGSSGVEMNNRAGCGTSGTSVCPQLTGVIQGNTVNGNGGVQFGFAGTGILVTETAIATDISGNTLVNNRPYGIGIYLNGTANTIQKNTVTDTQLNGILVRSQSTATTISNNIVSTSGESAIFVDDHSTVQNISNNNATGNSTCVSCTDSRSGLAVLNSSTVNTVDSNSFDQNSAGMEIKGSTVSSVTNCTFDANGIGGIFLEGATLTKFDSNKVRNNRGQGGFSVTNFNGGASTGAISNSEISGSLVTGLSFDQGSVFTLTSNLITNNGAQGGIYLTNGTKLTLTGNTVTSNLQNGIIATGTGTTATLSGNTVSGTKSDSVGNGFGLVASGGATMTCTGGNTLTGNAAGAFFGSVTGCQ